MYQKRALIVGATGIVGLNVAEYLRDIGGWQITGLARRPPLGCSYMQCRSVDLLSPTASDQIEDLDPTHVFYCTWTLGKTENDNIRLNGGMLRSVLNAFGGKSLRHVGVVTGTKHYLGPFEDYGKVNPVTPFREDAPRLPKKNFYYELEDVATEYAAKHGFGWSVHRSHTIIGYAVGNLMNIGATIAVYASICKATGQPFTFPGSPVAYRGLNDITDARLLARHIVWAGTEPNARNEAFNATNGDVFRWEQLWARIADYFSIPAAPYPESTNPLEPRMAHSGSTWDAIVADNNLQKNPLSRLASAWHTDFDLGRPMECLHSMAKSRALGFRDTQDSEQSFIHVFDRLRAERIIP